MNPIRTHVFNCAIGFVACLVLSGTAAAQSMSGIKIGDEVSAASRMIGTSPVAREQMGPFEARKWKLADGNELSVTARRDTGKVVYAETNWGGGTGGRASDFPGFTYGKTTLAEIRDTLGSGFFYKERMVAETPQGLALFNSYRIEGSSVVATFVARMSAKDTKAFKRNKNVSITGSARLDSIILSEADYLDTIWGEEKLTPDGSRPIRWEQLRMAFEGIWAATEAECKDEEGPNSRTLIDLQNIAKGKKAPLFDQYENHCRIADVIPAGIDIALKVTCYEFWENFDKNEDGHEGLVKLSARSAPLLEIDGRKFQLCKKL